MNSVSNNTPSFGMAHKLNQKVYELASNLPNDRSVARVLSKFEKQSPKLNEHLLDVDTTIIGRKFSGMVSEIRTGENIGQIESKINPRVSTERNFKNYIKQVGTYIKKTAQAEKQQRAKTVNEVNKALSQKYNQASKIAEIKKTGKILGDI